MTVVERANRRAVLIVHGVGEQRKSDTLLSIGSPIVSWVMRWAKLFYGRPAAQLGRVELSFVPFDAGDNDTPPMATLTLPDQQWYFAEAWWAGSSFHPDLSTMLYWSLVNLFDILAQMIRLTAERAGNLARPKGMATSSQPPRFWQLVDLLNCVLLFFAYALGVPLGYVLLVPLMLLAQIPIEAVQDFVLLKLLRPILTAGAGEFRMFLADELQAANVRRRVGDAARVLLRRAECDELIILAHSEGCVVALGMLTDPVYADVASRTRKLLTLGAGLNKSWIVAPGVDRLFSPLVGDTLWTDFWASYDPVPAGPLDPTGHRLADGQVCHMTDIYQPTADALAQVGAGQPPINEQVTNGMNVVTDHGGYFANEEQVLVRLAAEISAPHHADSSFWPAQRVLLDAVRKRRVRVAALALCRDIGFLAWLSAALVPWLAGWVRMVDSSTGAARTVDPWQALGSIAPESVGLAGRLLLAVAFLRDSLPSVLAPLSSLAGTLLSLPALVGLAALVGLVVWAIYNLVVWLWWQRWDAAARRAFLVASVESTRARLRAMATSNLTAS